MTYFEPVLLNLHHISVIALPHSLSTLIRASCSRSATEKASANHLQTPLNYFSPALPPTEATERLGDDSQTLRINTPVFALIYLPLI